MTFLDLFAGIGGFRRGLELAGHKCIGFCEFDKYATASYTAMHTCTEEQLSYLATLPLKERQKEILDDKYRNGEWYCKDIRSVTGDSIPIADCWCFGAPCQDFSVAGLGAGLAGDRSSLVREVFRIAGEMREEDRPEWLIYENVKGMLSSNRGFDFLTILFEMDELGYDCEWFVFNSKYHGVPQNRERVYLVGHLRSRGGQKIFPIEGTNEKDYFPVNAVDKFQEGRLNKKVEPRNTVPTLRAQIHGNAPEIVVPVLTPERATKRQNGRRFKDNGEPAFTLTAQDRHGVAINVDTNGNHTDDIITVELRPGLVVAAIWYERYGCYVAIRRLTPRECFRLQGWSDEYFDRAESVNSDTQLYKQAGNGVTVNVARVVGSAIGRATNE